MRAIPQRRHRCPLCAKRKTNPALAQLEKAHDLLKHGYVEAAANYVRQALESGMRAACKLKRIKLPYKQNSTHHKAQDLLEGPKARPDTAPVSRADWDAALHRLELMKNVVMNPYSHPNAPNIPRREVVEAADAAKKFLDLAKKK